MVYENTSLEKLEVLTFSGLLLASLCLLPFVDNNSKGKSSVNNVFYNTHIIENKAPLFESKTDTFQDSLYEISDSTYQVNN